MSEGYHGHRRLWRKGWMFGDQLRRSISAVSFGGQCCGSTVLVRPYRGETMFETGRACVPSGGRRCPICFPGCGAAHHNPSRRLSDGTAANLMLLPQRNPLQRAIAKGSISGAVSAWGAEKDPATPVPGKPIQPAAIMRLAFPKVDALLGTGARFSAYCINHHSGYRSAAPGATCTTLPHSSVLQDHCRSAVPHGPDFAGSCQI